MVRYCIIYTRFWGWRVKTTFYIVKFHMFYFIKWDLKMTICKKCPLESCKTSKSLIGGFPCFKWEHKQPILVVLESQSVRLLLLFGICFIQLTNWVNYRVSHRILPVAFFFDNFDMPQDIDLKFCIGILQTFQRKNVIISVLSSAQPGKFTNSKWACAQWLSKVSYN